MHPAMTEANDDPTIYEILHEQHLEVSELLEELQSEQDVAQREELFAEIAYQLERHARAEEAVFYDLLLQDDRTRPLAEHATEDHGEVRRLLAELDAMAADDPRWADSVAALVQAVQDHVATEESKIFAAARDLLDDDQARTLAETFEAIEVRVEEELDAEGDAEAAE